MSTSKSESGNAETILTVAAPLEKERLEITFGECIGYKYSQELFIDGLMKQSKENVKLAGLLFTATECGRKSAFFSQTKKTQRSTIVEEAP